jgi:hypothetical protein
MNRIRTAALAALLVFVTSVAFASPASASPSGASVYNYGPVGVGIYVDWNGGYDYVLTPGHWSYGNAKGMYVGPGWCVSVFYNGRYVWTGGPGTHSFAYYYNDRIQLSPYRC